jgi:hypothetical protein
MGWGNDLREVVDRAVAASAPPARIELQVNNLSSVSAGEAASINEWLESELARRGFHIVGSPPIDGTVTVTLSEGAEGYLIVAQIRRGPDEQVAMFPVPKDAQKARRAGEIVVDHERIWEQPGEILDFALPEPSRGEPQEMIVLESGRLVFYSYSLQHAQWEIGNAITIPLLRPWLRAPRGYMNLSLGLENGVAMLSGITCKGDFRSPGDINCSFESKDLPPWTVEEGWTAKNIADAGDSANVSLACDGRTVVLATGAADWTHADFIQAYELRTSSGQGAVASGHPAEFGGPVTSIWPARKEGVARAVVHNLQTGNHEAYIVKATCSH